MSATARKALGVLVCWLLWMTAAPGVAVPPPSSVPLPPVLKPVVVALLDASEAGFLYSETDAAGDEREWLKAPGAEPVESTQLDGRNLSMLGRKLYSYENDQHSFADWNSPPIRCAGSPYDATITPTGWAYLPGGDADVMIVTAAGCATRTFLATTQALRPRRIAGSDAGGLVIDSVLPDGSSYLGYYPYGDPGHPVRLDRPAGAIDGPGSVMAGGLLMWSDVGPYRIPVNGGRRQLLPASHAWSVLTSTGVAAYESSQLFTADFSGGAVQTLGGVSGGVFSDGTRFYTVNRPGETVGISSRTTAAGPARLEVAATPSTYRAEPYSIALSPGRVHDTVNDYTTSDPLHMASMWSLSSDLAFGPRTPLSRSVYAPIAASAGRFWYGAGIQLTYTGQRQRMPAPATNPWQASGNRLLVVDQVFANSTHAYWHDLYDVRTGRLANPLNRKLWPNGPQAIFANSVVHARADGAVLRRDLASGREIVLRPPGTRIRAVAIHGRWVAWVTGCATDDQVCSQTLTVQDSTTGTTRTVTTRGTSGLVLSGGHLVLDTITSTVREVRAIAQPAGTVNVLGTLPASWKSGMAGAYPNSIPRHFDLDDETVGWVDGEQVARVAKLPAFVEPPIYLGNVIAPTTFSPNGDGKADVWTMAFPVSKAMPTCTVKFYRGTTPVRFLSCAHTTGMAAAVWDGRTGSGAKLPAGRYTYRVNGYDADGWLRHTDLTLTPMVGSVTLTQ